MLLLNSGKSEDLAPVATPTASTSILSSSGGSTSGPDNSIAAPVKVEVETLIDKHLSSISKMCHILAAWLALYAGVSRTTVNTVLTAIRLILMVSIQLLVLVLHAYGHSIKTPHLDVPSDIRTIYHSESNGMNLDPDIRRIVCCPKCFQVYPTPNPPPRCTWRQTPRAHICNEPLTTIRRTRKGPKHVPRRLYNTQSFDSWLKFFLNRPDILNVIMKSYSQIKMPNLQGKRSGFWDSPACWELRDFIGVPGNLTFALYVDWFNPFTNKIAGKQVSCGVIILFCMNLPETIRYLPQNTFVYSTIPGPKAPNVVTISHVLESFVDILNEYWMGKKLSTQHSPPEGIIIRVAVVPVIADLQAIRKLSGFLGHSADLFCSWCLLTRQGIESLDYTNWPKRTSDEVRAQAEDWRKAGTIKLRNALASQNGVRWTPLFRLPYWKPVEHVILGFMHNSLEGILEHHLRTLWRIGPKDYSRPTGVEEQFTRADIRESDSELESLSADSSEEESSYIQAQLQAATNTDSSDMTIDDDTVSDLQPAASMAGVVSELDTLSSSTSTPHHSTPLMDLEDNDSDDEYLPAADGTNDFEFTKYQMQQIHECIAQTLLPTHINRPPSNLGEASHGKLKAYEYLILFTVIFPLIIPEFWHQQNTGGEEQRLLENFYDLVSSTNIIASFSTSVEEARSYMERYTSYRRSTHLLWPQIHSKPNHHYAMHNGDLLQYWGPLAALSEFPGERLNGKFQNIPTNRRAYDLDFTLLQQMCRRGRLLAYVEQNHATEPEVQQLAEVLSFSLKSKWQHDQELTPSQTAGVLKQSVTMEPAHYYTLLAYLRSTRQPWLDINTLPHPPDALILPPACLQPTELNIDGVVYSCYRSHQGNSAVQFYHRSPLEVYTGYIDAIWQIPAHGRLKSFFRIQLHQQLPTEQESKGPYHHNPGFQAKLVEDCLSGQFKIIEPSQIITHLAVYKRPAGTYQIDRDFLVICWALNRGKN